MKHKEACEAAAAHPPLPLFLNNGHYTTIVPNSAPFPNTWYRPLDAVWDAGNHRGGVARSTQTPSCKSWLPASSCAKSVKSFKSWLPPWTITNAKVAVSNKKALSVSNSRAATPQTTKSCSRASGSQNPPKAVPCQRGTEDHVWTCPLCSLRIEADTSFKLGKKGTAHFQFRHPNADRRNSRIRAPLSVIPATSRTKRLDMRIL